MRRAAGLFLRHALLGIALGAAPWATGAAPTGPVDRFPGAAASYVVAVDGEVRWARAADERRPVASLAKLLAALVLLERPGWRPDAVVTVGARAARVEGTRLGLRSGEQARAGELLGAMLLASSNDACLALADHAGARAAFVADMNARAAALGLRDSHFEHPCGLDRPGQFSTANDLLRLATAALGDARIARLARRETGELVTLAGRHLAYRSSNLLLGRLDGATGLKTGTTTRAGHCLIASARRDGHEVVVVLLDAGDRWNHAAILIEEALHGVVSRP